MNSATILPSPPAADSRLPSRAWTATFRPAARLPGCRAAAGAVGKLSSLGRRASHLGRLRRWLGRLLRRRTRLAAALAQLEAVTAQLVAPVLALERPEHLVVLDLRRVAAARGRGTGLLRRRCGQLLLAARDLEGKAQRLPEQLAQLGPLRLEPREEPAAGALDQLDARLARQRTEPRRQRRSAERRGARVDGIDFPRQLRDGRDGSGQVGLLLEARQLLARLGPLQLERAPGEKLIRALRRGELPQPDDERVV